jgi:hypothetical protein
MRAVEDQTQQTSKVGDKTARVADNKTGRMTAIQRRY